MRLRAFLLAILLACLSGPSQAQQPELRLVLGSATPGGGLPAYGEALAAAIREVDPGLILELRATGGSVENLRLLRAGALDLALVQGEFAYDALAAEPANGSGLTVVVPMYPTPGLFVVPADSPVSGIAALRGRAVALGTRNSGLTAMGRSVLQASGLDPDRDIEPLYLERAGDGPGLVSQGRAAALWG
ncbi:TAXI family TRAP transporter solute-binding subunit, partial [Methylobacterium trifolii]